MSTVYDLKREVEKPERLTGGHRLCAGVRGRGRGLGSSTRPGKRGQGGDS